MPENLTEQEKDALDDWWYPPDTEICDLNGKLIHVTPPSPIPLEKP